MMSDRSPRSYARLTAAHLARLAELAAADHERFTAPTCRPEYRNRLLLVVLAQGAAQHYVDGKHGVKDLDVWQFYAAIPGQPFPADRRNLRADFGVSVLGRQRYDYAAATSARQRRQFQDWDRFSGRRVDLLSRQLPAPLDAEFAAVTAALRTWLTSGATIRGATKPSAWFLAQRPVVGLVPLHCRGELLWPPH